MLLFPVTEVYAQNESLTLTYGNVLYRKNFGDQLNTLSDYTQGNPLEYVGFIYTGILKINRKKRDYPASFSALKYLPRTFQVNDSVSAKLTGSVYGFSIGFDCFPKSDMFDFVFSGGLNLGRMKLVQQHWDYLKYKDNSMHLKNMLVCPKLMVYSIVHIKRFNISFTGEYAYDISGSKWKEKTLALGKPRSSTVPGFNQSALYVSVGIGYYLPVGSRSNYD